MNFEVTKLLKFWIEKIVEIDLTERERPILGLLLKKVPEVVSTFSGEEVTERVRLSPGKVEHLGNLNVIHKLILPHRKESEGVMSKLSEPGNCLDLASEDGEHSCEGRSCVTIQSFQSKDLATWFGDITEKEKSEVFSG